MPQIKDLFERRIDRTIEEVITIDQHDEKTVKEEIEEYVATESIKNHFITVYDKLAEYEREPHRGVGVWVSGFFGSGKSSFAKILGYTLANREIVGEKASARFAHNVSDSKIENRLVNLNARYPIHAVIFDVSMDRGARTASDRITEVMYKVLLRELGYPVDFDLAELEMTLEGDGQLAEFEKRYEKKSGKPWAKGKLIVTNALNDASIILHEMQPKRFASPDSWLLALGEGRADIDANKLARLTFELAERRIPGKGIIFIIDEVGQFVSRSTDKMLDLQAIVQALGKESENRVRAGKAKVPAWIVVTSQEKLEEVVDALDERRIELARLLDRFPTLVDLKQSDIREVTAVRVLQKNKDAQISLADLYKKYEGRLKTNTSLERTHRRMTFDKQEFIQLYPYLPYQIELSIEIVSGLRSRRGAQRHVGGSNRTIIKQAQQMLINPITNLGDKNIGALVTLDRIYDLLSVGNLLTSEVTAEIHTIPERLPNDDTALKAAKAICLLEVVKDLPRTVHNIAAVLHPAVTADSAEADVQKALKRLEEAQFIRETEQGYKLLSVAEKNWDVERIAKSPKKREKHEIIEQTMSEIFSEPSLKTFRYKNIKTFTIGATINGRKINDGQVMLHVEYADEMNERDALINDAKRKSRSDEFKNDLFWALTLNDSIHKNLTEYFRSKMMVQGYSRMHAQGEITADEIGCLEDEKHREHGFAAKLKTELLHALEAGCSIHQGVEKDGSLFGQRFAEMLKAAFDEFIPRIYTKLDVGARNMTGKEAEQLLKAANLNALSTLFYSPPQGLDLVQKHDDRFIINQNAPVLQELFRYIKSQEDYGNRVTGKLLENHFSNPPYGWERDLLRLLAALLFRAGAIEVTHQGQRFKSYTDPNAWPAFVNNVVFRGASFLPQIEIDIPTLVAAEKQFEEISGRQVDVDQVVLTTEFQKLAREDLKIVQQNKLAIQHDKLPGLEILNEFENDLQVILNGSTHECISILAKQGSSYKENRSFVLRLSSLLTGSNIEILLNARKAVENLWPLLIANEMQVECEADHEQISSWFKSEEVYEHLKDINTSAGRLYKTFSGLYEKKHAERNEKAQEAIEYVKGQPDALSIENDLLQNILTPLKRRQCAALDISWDGHCVTCAASLQQLESDIYSINGLVDAAVAKLHKSTESEEEKTITISTTKYFKRSFDSVDDFKRALDMLQQDVEKAFLEGKRVYIQ